MVDVFNTFSIKASTTAKLNGVICNFGRHYFECKYIESWVIFVDMFGAFSSQ